MDHQAKVAAPAPRAPVAGARANAEAPAITDLRPAAAAQRDLRSIADAAPQSRRLGALQRMADRRGARQGPLTPLLLSTSLPPVQRIKGGVQGNVGKKVTEKEKGKETIVGEITGMQGVSHYLVQFPGEPKPRAVLATKLVVSRGGAKDADETPDEPALTPTPGGTTPDAPKLGAATTAATSADPTSDDEGPSASLSLSTAPQPSQSSSHSPSSLQPTHLQIEKSDNRWVLTLLSDGFEVAKTDPLANGVVKNYTSTITVTKLTKPRAGTFELVKDVVLKGELALAYEKAKKTRAQEAERQAYASELASQVDLTPGQHSQAEIMTTLRQLQGAKSDEGKGNADLQMTSIKLVSDIYLVVGGVEHRITHLYTQPGNKDEIRCYLGTKDGAYQRVHTSITSDNSSHTMVQTSDRLSTPGNVRKATRMGWDAKEGVLSETAAEAARQASAEPYERKGKAPAPESVKGFAVRKLTYRPKDKCDVDNLKLSGLPWDDLTADQKKGCQLLAERFNAALDQVCADISTGDPSKRTVGKIGTDFRTLDDSWLFQPPGLSLAPGVAATPDEEWRRRGDPVDTRERQEREREKASSSSSLSSPSFGASSSSSSLTSPSWSSSSSSHSAPPPSSTTSSSPPPSSAFSGPPSSSASSSVHAIDAESYATTLSAIGASASAIIVQPHTNVRIYADYPLSPAQIETLGGGQLLLTTPDGDCSFNAVLESAGIERSINDLRAEIARQAMSRDLATKEDAENMVQPGNWEHSDVTLPVLCDHLGVELTVIGPTGAVILHHVPPKREYPPVTIFHVSGSGGAGHYYGSR